MIGFFNRFLNTWAARVFFLILLIALASWGVGDVLRNLGTTTDLARVGGQEISPQEFQAAFRTQLSKVEHMMGGNPPGQQIRETIAHQVMDRLLLQAAVADEVARLNLAVPDEALRRATFDIPAFKDPQGKFDHARFLAVLRNNDMTEDHFLNLMRADLGQQQLIGAVQAGAFTPDTLTDAAFRFAEEKRVAETVTLPFAGAPQPAEPTQADLQREYDNNPQSYTSPEYRRIKAVILSVDTIARNIQVPDTEIRAAYEQHKAQYTTEEKRSLRVLVAPDEAGAQKLRAQWVAGTDWDTLQAHAKQIGGSAVSLDDATQSQIPSTELATSAFQLKQNDISQPFHNALGWQVAQVTKIVPGGTRSFDSMKDELRDQIARQEAADVVYDRADKVQEALASGSKLDELPADLGLAAVAGTLDANGTTPDGEPAPLPAPPDVRAVILKAVFAAHVDDQPQLAEVAGKQGAPSSYYAVVVDKISPPERKAFDAVQTELREDWLRQARHHETEEQAAKLLTAVKNGQDLQDAAILANLPAAKSAPIPRPNPRLPNNQPVAGVPPEMVRILFGLKKQEGTMVETPDGFVVGQLLDIQPASRATDPIGYGRARDELTGAMGNDLEVSYVAALRDRAKPRINQARFNSMIQQPGS